MADRYRHEMEFDSENRYYRPVFNQLAADLAGELRRRVTMI